MTCHQAIATDRPEIKKIAAYKARGEEIPWVRVYNQEVNRPTWCSTMHRISGALCRQCATCHDDMTKQTTAERKVNLNMGFCINCHVKKQVSIDCVTCHN